MIDGQKFLTEFLEAGRAQGMASDDAYETGFATLTDKEGHPYVAHLDSGTGKKDEKKSESEQDLTKAEIKKKLKNLYEKAKKELHKELRKKREKTTGEKLSDEEIEKSIKDYERNDTLKYVSDKPIFRLMSNLNDAEKITPKLLKDVKDFFGKNQLSMDSAEFKEIQSLLNELDNGNNGLDLFINNVNIEER